MEAFLKDFIQAFNIDHDEQERLKMIVQRHGAVNWKEVFGPSQFKSKMALVSAMKSRIRKEDCIVLLGGWIGLVPYLMELYHIQCASLTNVEIDHAALVAADAINEYASFTYERKLQDARGLDYSSWCPLVVINTSCEHFSDYECWLSSVPDGTLCFLQSNNMFGIEEHINCHQSMGEFVAAAKLCSVEKTEEIDIGDGWKRFMIIGHK